MKLIVAIIRPERLEPVQEALRAALDEAENYRITVDPVLGHGRQQGEVAFVRGQPLQSPLVDKTRVTVAVNDAYVESAVQAILEAARSAGGGRIGDGKIFVVPLEDCIRIRTGERGGGAI